MSPLTNMRLYLQPKMSMVLSLIPCLGFRGKKDTCSAWQELKVKVYSSLLIFAYFQSVLKASEVPASQVKGMGFDATCSLVALSADFQPVSCSPTGEVRGQVDLTFCLFVCVEDVWVFVHRPSQLQSGMNCGITAI